MKKILFLVFTILLISSTIYAKNYNITFEWDRNSEPDLAGYKLYQRDISSDYSQVADIMKDANSYILEIDITSQNFWVLTAYDESGNESDYSNEVNFIPDLIIPLAPSGLIIKSISVIIDF